MLTSRSGAKTTRAASLMIAIILAFSLTFSSMIAPAYADVRKADIIVGQSVEERGLSIAECPDIEAEYALVMSDDGTVFFERNSASETQLASIVKIMTALVALDNAPLDTQMTVSTQAASIGESTASLKEGDTLDLKNALYALMIPSGNDAAQAIAESVGALKLVEQGIARSAITEDAAEEEFVKMMNEKAVSLGMESSLFSNPHGLDDGVYASDQHSCANDVAKMAQAAMAHETFREVVASPVGNIEVTHSNGAKETYVVETTNELLVEDNGFCGIKTGFTNAAGASFAGVSTSEHGYLYAIVLHSTTTGQRFVDAQTLVDWVIQHYIDYPLANSTVYVDVDMATSGFSQANVPVVAEVAHTDWIDKTVKGTLANPQETVSVFDLNGNIAQTVAYEKVVGNINIGDKIGELTFTQRNGVVATADIVACENVAAPNFFEGVGIWWERLFSSFSGQQEVADSILINTTPLINDKTM